MQGLQQDPAGESGFAHAGRPHEYQILVLGDEIEFGEGADLLAVHAGLPRVGKRFQRPAFWQIRPANAPLQRAFLAVVPLRAQQSGDELRVGGVGLLGGTQLLVIHVEHALQLEVLQ